MRSRLQLLTIVSSIVFIFFGPAFGEPTPTSSADRVTPTAPASRPAGTPAPAAPTTTTTITPPPAPTDPCASGWSWREVRTPETGAVVEIQGEARSPFPIFGGEVICARPAASQEIPAPLVDALRGVGRVWVGSGGQGPQYFFTAEAEAVPTGPVPGIPCPLSAG